MTLNFYSAEVNVGCVCVCLHVHRYVTERGIFGVRPHNFGTSMAKNDNSGVPSSCHLLN
jgi:hypothetical protein